MTDSADGADTDDETPTDTGEPCPDSVVTWQNFAGPFIRSWCQPCHSVYVVGDDRQGAPADMNFDTYEQVVEAAPVLPAFVWGDAPAMPPSGGVSDADRDTFVEWIQCGTQGEPGDPVPACESATDLGAGHAVALASASEAAAFCAAGAVKVGSLTVSGSVGSEADCVCAAHGAVRVTGGAANVQLGSLREVGSLEVQHNPSLTRLELPALDQVSGTVAIEDNPVLVLLDIPELANVGGDFDVRSDGLGGTLYLKDVTGIGGALAVSANPRITELSIPRLLTVGTSLELDGNASLAQLAFIDTLIDVGTDFVIRENDALEEIHGFQRLTGVGNDIIITGNDSVLQIQAFQTLQAIPGDVVITENDGMRGVFGFTEVTSIGGDMIMADNPELQFSGAELFRDVADIGGSFVFRDNPSARGLSGFLSLTDVGGEMRFEALEGLLTLEVAPLLERIGGDLIVLDVRDLDTLGFGQLESIGGNFIIEHGIRISQLRFGSLTTVGGLRFQYNWLATMNGIAQLTYVGGDLQISDMTLIQDLQGLHGITAVDGDFTIRMNEILPQAQADDLLAAIGPANISGNILMEYNGG